LESVPPATRAYCHEKDESTGPEPGYLCGAMDRVTDGGVGWRQDLIQSLKDLKILWLDPTRKPIDIGVEDLENRALRHKAKRPATTSSSAAR